MRRGQGASDVLCLMAGFAAAVALTIAAGYLSQIQRFMTLQAAETLYVEAVHANEQARLFMETAVDFILKFSVDDVSKHGGVPTANSTQASYLGVPLSSRGVLFWRWCAESGPGGGGPVKTVDEDVTNCPQDCGLTLDCNHDRICQDTENCKTCDDCVKTGWLGAIVQCGNRCCEPSEISTRPDGTQTTSCPRDCFICGNGNCEAKGVTYGSAPDSRYTGCGTMQYEPVKGETAMMTNCAPAETKTTPKEERYPTADETYAECGRSNVPGCPHTTTDWLKDWSDNTDKCCCEKDCQPVTNCKPDGVCSGTDTCENCQQDCDKSCGNGWCEPDKGETVQTCKHDCFECGNLKCEKYDVTKAKGCDPAKIDNCKKCTPAKLGDGGYPTLKQVVKEGVAYGFANKTEAYAKLFTENELEHPTVVKVSGTVANVGSSIIASSNGSILTWTAPLSMALKTNQPTFGTVNTSSSRWRADDCANMEKLWDNFDRIATICNNSADSSRKTIPTKLGGDLKEDVDGKEVVFMKVACVRFPWRGQCCEYEKDGKTYRGYIDYNVTTTVTDMKCKRQMVRADGLIETEYNMTFAFQYREDLERESDCRDFPTGTRPPNPPAGPEPPPTIDPVTPFQVG